MNELIDSVIKGNMDKVRDLIDNGYDINCEDSIALYRAIDKKNVEMTNMLLDSGIKVQKKNSDMFLYAAAKHGLYEVAKRLVEEFGAKVNPTDPDATTPMVAAAKSKNIEVVQYLIDQGADITEPRVLMFAVTSQCAEVVEAVLKAGADANTVYDGRIHILYIAGINGTPEIIEILKKYGAKKMVTESG